MLPWTLEDIDLTAVPVANGEAEETLALIIAAASLVESASHLYTSNLTQYFATDLEVSRWLIEHWEPEELQHGRALRAWTERAWPDFDWEATFKDFLTEYSMLCRLDSLEATPALEMVARCVVETGTAALYRSLSTLAHEPVLRQLTSLIHADEVRHYKYFYRFFRRYQGLEHLSRWRISRVLFERSREIRRDDSGCAIRHIVRARGTGKSSTSSQVNNWTQAIHRQVRQGCPYDMAARMFLAPLDLPPGVRLWVSGGLAIGARVAMQGLPWRSHRAWADERPQPLG